MITAIVMLALSGPLAESRSPFVKAWLEFSAARDEQFVYVRQSPVGSVLRRGEPLLRQADGWLRANGETARVDASALTAERPGRVTMPPVVPGSWPPRGRVPDELNDPAAAAPKRGSAVERRTQLRAQWLAEIAARFARAGE